MSKPPTEHRDWSSASEALFRSARGGHAPTASDRERVHNALAQRLANAPNAPIAGLGADALLNVTRESGVVLFTLVKLGFGLGILMAGVLVFLRAGHSPKAVDSKPAAPAGMETARVTAPVAAPPAAQPVARSNEEPAVAAEDNASVNAARPSRDRGSVAIGSARARSGIAANGARARENLAARDNASAPASAQTRGATVQVASHATGDAEVGPAAPAQMSGSTARTPGGTVRGSAARTPAQTSGTALAPATTDNSLATRSPSRSDAASTARAQARSDSGSVTRTAVRVDDDADRVVPSSDDEDSAKHAAAPSQREVDEPANVELDPSDPRAELFFVRRIQAALRDDEPREVLSLCAEHERRWPRGTFVQEREGLRVVASCQSGARDAAARADKFFAAYPRGPLAPRVRQACASQLKAAAVAPRTPASGEVDRR